MALLCPCKILHHADFEWFFEHMFKALYKGLLQKNYKFIKIGWNKYEFFVNELFIMF